MWIMFSLTDAGRRVHDRPGRYPQHGAEMALLAAMQAHDALSFEDIIRSVSGEMFKVLQAMATAMASGLLEELPDTERAGKDRGLGHGRW